MRKRITFSYIDWNEGLSETHWIEGVGSVTGLLTHLDLCNSTDTRNGLDVTLKMANDNLAKHRRKIVLD